MKFACWGACGPFRVSNAFQIDVLNLVTGSSTPGLTWELCSVVEVPEEAFLPADKSLDEQKKWLVVVAQSQVTHSSHFEHLR